MTLNFPSRLAIIKERIKENQRERLIMHRIFPKMCWKNWIPK
jgi:hypothetical protein